MRKAIGLFLFFALILLAAFPVYAHPGKTDSNGGHYDYENGGYHYHHGYPAHDHYDMDGDGVIDCPYDFDDQTGANSGTPSSGESSLRWNYPNDSFQQVVTVYEEKEVIKEVRVMPKWAMWALAIAVFWILRLYIRNHRQAKQISRLRQDSDSQQIEINKLKSEATAYNADDIAALNMRLTYWKNAHQEKSADVKKLNQYIHNLSSQYSALQAENEELHSGLMALSSSMEKVRAEFLMQGKRNSLTDVLKIPPDIYFINGGSVPVRGTISQHRPFGDFTVYVAHRGRCYHSDYYCGNGFLSARHAYDVISKLPPCKNCGKIFPESVPEWYITVKSITDSASRKDISTLPAPPQSAIPSATNESYEQIELEYIT